MIDEATLREEMRSQSLMAEFGDENAERRRARAQTAFECGNWESAIQYLRGELK